MLYLVAIVLSFAACAQAVASELASGNIKHLKHGRKPNAGVALLPMIPVFQLVALGLAWVLEQVVPNYAILVLVALYLCIFLFWVVSYKRLRSQLQVAVAAVNSKDRA
ncbi:hypothetical protein DO97_18050 [Neosynechococcus sphagnicola sy1]|uniref:Uncharacterized protein n=1 Tax=Neosynechococcus sphagnicola sy1 TaxID=1497020 RepID=A0A098THD8_9CYAN|nr:hypothetical protein [Neosynechococcus sphagnicola]KGF71499.1 hypothetical protein DO97_18050 [Neosynechococcus sphagnicola sy1]